jgi:hypothetical protein
LPVSDAIVTIETAAPQLAPRIAHSATQPVEVAAFAQCTPLPVSDAIVTIETAAPQQAPLTGHFATQPVDVASLAQRTPLPASDVHMTIKVPHNQLVGIPSMDISAPVLCLVWPVPVANEHSQVTAPVNNMKIVEDLPSVNPKLTSVAASSAIGNPAAVPTTAPEDIGTSSSQSAPNLALSETKALFEKFGDQFQVLMNEDNWGSSK